jgi:hypothetical protein
MEEWKKIEGFENYSASTFGRIRNDKTGTIRKLQTYTKGYYSVRINGKNLLVHRLIAKTFIENPDRKPVVDHINGDRQDNRTENLRWVTTAENLLSYGHEERCNFHRMGVCAINVVTGEKIYFVSKTECANHFGCDKSRIKIDHLYKQRNKANWIFKITKPHKSKVEDIV